MNKFFLWKIKGNIWKCGIHLKPDATMQGKKGKEIQAFLKSHLQEMITLGKVGKVNFYLVFRISYVLGDVPPVQAKLENMGRKGEIHCKSQIRAVKGLSAAEV